LATGESRVFISLADRYFAFAVSKLERLISSKKPLTTLVTLEVDEQEMMDITESTHTENNPRLFQVMMSTPF
jgi:hypothetical protein